MKHRILAFVLCLAAASAELGAQTLGVSPVFFKTYAGSGTPSDPCSATQYNGVIEINGSLAAYQCSKAGGSFAWNGLGAPGGSVTSVSNSDGTLAISPTTGAVVASLNLGNANIWTANQTGPAWIANGSTAGYLALAQGSTNAGSIPSNSILFQAPASVTSFAVTMPGAAASGWLTWTASGGNVTESLTPPLSLTTSGTSGAATLNTSTNVLNIPQYSGGGGSSGPTAAQETFTTNSGGSSVPSITSSSVALTNGDIALVACRWGGTTYATSDPASGSAVTTWHALAAQATSSNGLELSWGIVTNASAATYTCTPSSSSAYQSMIVIDIGNTSGTLNNSAGGTAGTLTSYFGFAEYFALHGGTTTGRSFAVTCVADNSGAGVYINPWLVSTQIETSIFAIEASGIGSASELACNSAVIPSSLAVAVGGIGLNTSTSPTSLADETAFFNY